MAKKIIDSKRPPLLWDTVDDAFSKINDNFTELYLTVGGGGGPVDLTNIGSSINPSDSMIYDLGTPTNRWRRLYVGGGAIYVDNAPITATGSTLELPFGTKVGGVLIKDPAEGSFKNIAVSGQTNVVAEDLKDTLTLAGNGINITTNASTDTVTFSNAGVTSAVAGTGIAVSSATGAVTISNSGVTAVTGGTGIGVSAGTGSVTISNSGVTQLIAGSNIILSASTGAITITNGSPNILQNVFRFIAVSGEDTLDPISANSTLNFAAGSNIVLTTDALTNTVTISSPNVQDIVGSIFADDSTLLVDAVDGKIVGPINSFDGANSISMHPTNGVIIGGTGGASVIGAATAPVYIGAGPSGSTSGTVTIGHGANLVSILNATISGTLNGNVNGNVAGNVTGNVTGDIKGSVFGSDSSMLVDGTGSRIVGAIATSSLRTSEASIYLGYNAGAASTSNYTVGIGWEAQNTNPQGYTVGIGPYAGRLNQAQAAVAIGSNAGETSQGNNAVALGVYAGQTNQGINAIAIGNQAGKTNQPAGSIVINADGGVLNGSAAGFYVNPIREITGPQALYYDPTGKEITWGPVPAGGGGGGGSGGDFDLSVAADDSTLRKINSGETLKFVGASGITTASNGEGAITITGPTDISGNAATSTRTNTLDITNTNGLTTVYYPTFVENRSTAQTVRADADLTYRTDTNTLTAGGFVGNLFTNLIDSADSSQILVTPLMRFQSDVVIENELSVNNSATVSGRLTVNHLTVTGTITAQGSGTPEIYSDNEILLTAGTRVEINGSPLKMSSFSTAQRDALSATNGDMIYNSSTNKFQGYANGTWVDLH